MSGATKDGGLSSQTCMLCGCRDHTVFASRIREGEYIVLQCVNCDFIFLADYRCLDYSNGYGTLTYGSDWDVNEAIQKRSKSLVRFNEVVAGIVGRHGGNVLELGAGIGASIHCLRDLLGNVTVDCVELNKNDALILQDRFGAVVYSDIKSLQKKYSVVYGHHIFEHFVDPLVVLADLDRVTTIDCRLYFSLPNLNDFYSNTLKLGERLKYQEFNFHLAHPYYYTQESITRLISGSDWFIESIETIQDYSIVNYFGWYINGIRSKNIEDATKVMEGLQGLNRFFVEYIESRGMGNNLSVVLTKK